jgi:hypothetical protein
LPCGEAVGDAEALAAMEGQVGAACPCCDFPRPGALRRCVVPLAKQAVTAGTLSRRCGRRLLHDMVHGCRVAGCGPTTTTLPDGPCTADADCDDGNPCTADRCQGGVCAHECLCVSALGAVTCCPGPAASCAPPTTTTLPSPCDPGQCRYYDTCGYPVCSVDDQPIPGVAPCTSQKLGDPCSLRDETCDPGTGCGVRLVCTDSDPTLHGCPISRREAKRDVRYLADTDLDHVLDELRRVRLARYRYRGEPDGVREHLGFIIDDLDRSPAVADDGDHVDLYGYTSMAVAAIQAQQRRIDTLEREVAALRRALSARAAGRGSRARAPR